MNATVRRIPSSLRHQRGVATLLVALVVLVILTIIVLSSANVGLFEQKTANNEYRQRLADQAAEYALNLGGEFLKANVVNIASTEPDGWLLAGASLHWVRCSTVGSPMPADHPCMAEPNATRRAELYFYEFGSSTSLPYNSLVPVGAQLGNVGSVFVADTTTVTALMCRLDTTITTVISGVPTGTPQCRAVPDSESTNRIAVTVVAQSALTGENARSEMKGTWGTFDSFGTGAAVPLVASGSVDGAGNVEIVTASNGGGTGIPVSIWSRTDADVDKTGGGSAASVGTCQVGEFIKSTPLAQLYTTCATSNTACGCPSPSNGATQQIVYAKNPNFLSGHVPGAANCCENIDILDVDRPDPSQPEGTPSTNVGKGASPDITFFPSTGLDVVGDLTDDSLFEWVFGRADESESTLSPVSGTGQTLTGAFCGAPTGVDCAIYDLTQTDRLNAQSVSCATLNALGSSATGLYYVNDSSAGSPCSLPSQVGTPDAPALVVVNDEARLNSTLLYGMLFVRSATKNGYLRANGNAQVYGSVVIEGSTDIAGGLRIVYNNIQISRPGKKLPENTRFGFVPGTWLDGSRSGF